MKTHYIKQNPKALSYLRQIVRMKVRNGLVEQHYPDVLANFSFSFSSSHGSIPHFGALLSQPKIALTSSLLVSSGRANLADTEATTLSDVSQPTFLLTRIGSGIPPKFRKTSMVQFNFTTAACDDISDSAFLELSFFLKPEPQQMGAVNPSGVLEGVLHPYVPSSLKRLTLRLCHIVLRRNILRKENHQEQYLVQIISNRNY